MRYKILRHFYCNYSTRLNTPVKNACLQTQFASNVCKLSFIN